MVDNRSLTTNFYSIGTGICCLGFPIIDTWSLSTQFLNYYKVPGICCIGFPNINNRSLTTHFLFYRHWHQLHRVHQLRDGLHLRHLPQPRGRVPGTNVKKLFWPYPTLWCNKLERLTTENIYTLV
jgi:hypothetical protein